MSSRASWAAPGLLNTLALLVLYSHRGMTWAIVRVLEFFYDGCSGVW